MTVNDTRIDFAEQCMSACNRATIHSRNRNLCTFPDAVIENVSTTSIRSGHLGFARPASWRTPRTVPATVAVIDCCYAYLPPFVNEPLLRFDYIAVNSNRVRTVRIDPIEFVLSGGK